MLDLAPLGGKTIAVADVPQDGWDASWLARALGSSSWAQTTRTRFCAVPVRLPAAESERHLNAYDLARQYEQPERRQQLWLRRVLSGLASSNPFSNIDCRTLETFEGIFLAT